MVAEPLTIAGNVPMNKSLDLFKAASATSAAISALKLSFEKTWNQLNNIRTVAVVIAFMLTLLVCLIKQHVTELKIL